MLASLLEGFERRGKGSRELAPSGHRGVRVLDPHERDTRAVRNDEVFGNFEAARFCPEFDLLGRAHVGFYKVVVVETGALQGRKRGVLVAPMALDAASRECVAGNDVAVLKGAFRLIV